MAFTHAYPEYGLAIFSVEKVSRLDMQCNLSMTSSIVIIQFYVQTITQIVFSHYDAIGIAIRIHVIVNARVSICDPKIRKCCKS